VCSSNAPQLAERGEGKKDQEEHAFAILGQCFDGREHGETPSGLELFLNVPQDSGLSTPGRNGGEE
jgi:hypothetical protein